MKQTQRLIVRLTEKEGNKIRQIAKKSKVSISEIIRDALHAIYKI